ncbi:MULTISPECIES: competence/damage-inducible protein A [Sphingobacterium]|uniref:competence/damage-inducible protein A n=1 Tax=Sphingobacterium TaxID=28453 RepID=UPI0013DC340F|nr:MULTISPECIES: competence/damage-inducible protein A [unclassified Sphingobacterium]
MKTEIITIGDEILLGQIVDTNSAWLGQLLDSLHISIQQITSISDSKDAIYGILREAAGRSDLIIVTGGLGPTKDDVTKETIASFFNTTLVRDEIVLSHVKSIFEKTGRIMPVMNYGQADVLACSEVLFNDVGTAPGMWVEHEGKCFVFLPGVPFEMKFLMENRVMPKLVNYRPNGAIYHAHVITMGIGESFLAEKIADIENELPSYIRLAYLPKLGTVRLRLSAVGTDVESLKAETDQFAERIGIRLSDHLVARKDITIEEAIVEEFTQAGLRLAIAESCTGGLLAGSITAIPGASAVFDCGVVAYHNRIKEQVLGVEEEVLREYGAVSEQTVIQMAEGVKQLSGAQYSIATSGIAGPGGGTLDKPVGTVWIAVSGKFRTTTQVFHFRNDRKINIERSIGQALNMLWKLYKQDSVES